MLMKELLKRFYKKYYSWIIAFLLTIVVCLIAYFNYQDGSALEDYNGKYCTSGGKVCASSEFSPKYSSSNYNDFKIFMPYSELHMGKGSSKLDFYLNIWIDGKNYYKGIRHKFNYNSN